METDEAALEKFGGTHSSPPVVVCISDDEAGKDEEKLYGKVSVVAPLVEGTGGKCFKEMVNQHHQGGDSPQAVENGVMGFGIGKGGR